MIIIILVNPMNNMLFKIKKIMYTISVVVYWINFLKYNNYIITKFKIYKILQNRQSHTIENLFNGVY